jgi:hypothetical protein
MDQDSATNGVQPLTYSNPANAIDGYKAANGGSPNETKMDLSAWDQAYVCGSCHPGGGFMEMDRNGVRYSMMPSPMQVGFNVYNSYVFEKYDPLTGQPAGHTLEPAPWIYPIYQGSTPMIVTPGAYGPGSGGWGQAFTMTMPDGAEMPIFDNQVMMPNVKEFDCLQCHGEGFNQLMSSVMAYSGAHNASPAFGAGFMNMFTEAYDFTRGLISKGANIPGMGDMVVYNAGNLRGNPASTNCQGCHLPSTFKDLPDMFRDFLSSAPMIYTGSFKKSFTGLSFPAYDLNAPFAYTWDWKVGPFATSPVQFFDQQGNLHTTATTAFDLMIPAGWPSAMGVSEFNKTAAAQYGGYVLDPFAPGGFLGGGNPAGTLYASGPIYYQNTIPGFAPYQDQNTEKKSVLAFPRAEWFKRGDVWIDGYDVHKFLQCAGCHMDTATTKVDNDATGFNGKSTCDPGRGFDAASGIESSDSPAILAAGDHSNTYNKGTGFAAAKVNSQSTVKSCENCHVTGKNNQGVAIETFGAPNPTGAHTLFGLYDATTRGVNAMRWNETTKQEETFKGSHMDVLDCTVCHLYRKQMVVRTLDSTSGLRFPNMLGLDPSKGMMGMFQDPYGQGAPLGNNEEEWKPLFTWQKWGNVIKQEQTAENPWRRKIYAINYINAVIWNNEDPTIDANGDGVTGRPPYAHGHNGDGGPTYNYDNWIMRDMKAGMNFAPGGFANVPAGFGNGAYQSAYNMDGTLNTSWQYVGLYGGNVIFSTPEEIDSYLTMRGPQWAGTKLTYAAAPFKMTHGIRPVGSMKVLGRSCADCHAPNAGFFDGDFEMLGYAVNTATAQTLPAPYTGNMMVTPAELMKVTAKAEQLETGAELARKEDGKLVELQFDEHGDWDAQTKTFTPNPAGEYKTVTPIERGTVLFPTEMSYTGADGNVYPNRAAWLKHLTDIAAPPVAAVASVSPGTVNGSGYTVATGSSITFAGADQDNPSFTYQWTFSDGVTVPAGLTATRTFATVNTVVNATLTVKNTVTNATASVTKPVTTAFAGNFTISHTVPNALYPRKIRLSITGMNAAHSSIRVEWGDGTTNNYTTAATSFTAPSATTTKTYYGTVDRTVKVRIFSGTKQVDEKTYLVDMP